MIEPTRVPPQLRQSLLEQMNYSPLARCCQKCRHFVAPRQEALLRRAFDIGDLAGLCKLSLPIAVVDVSADGVCDFFKEIGQLKLRGEKPVPLPVLPPPAETVVETFNDIAGGLTADSADSGQLAAAETEDRPPVSER